MSAIETPAADAPGSEWGALRGGGTLLAQGASLEIKLVDKLAHALGWPSVAAMRRGRPGRVKWANPYRNYYASGEDEDPAWAFAAKLGLARRAGEPSECFPYVRWTVTRRGRQVTRLRLQATRWAAELDAEAAKAAEVTP